MVLSKLKSILKFVFSLALAAGLFWYVYRDTNLDEVIAILKKVKYGWVIFSMILGGFAYLLRAVRWQLLLQPFANKATLFNVFTGLMVGYLGNLVLPRMGEVTRCAWLKKSDNVPFTSSLGTVVTERLVDVLTLLLVTVFTLFLEFDTLMVVFRDFWHNLTVFANNSWHQLANLAASKLPILLIGGFSILILLLALLWLFKNTLDIRSLFGKAKQLLRGIWEGLISITKVEKQGLFWATSVLIWVIYFIMTYVVFDAMEATMSLGWRVGLSIMVMGGIGMALPVPGGVGSFHGLVTQCLVLYGIAAAEGGTFAFLVHSSQLLVILILGVFSVVTALLVDKKGTGREVAP
ncbi:MAG: lysylphosphatidylglycerol synthase transmembrane domain-containing protein [Cyclobacteriaceae bacterium]